MKITKIYGAPGTGKTTRLFQIIKEEIENGTDPKRLAFISFSRSAIQEAKDRIIDSGIALTVNDTIYWRTLHSLAYKLVDMGLIDNLDSKSELNKLMNIRVKPLYELYHENKEQFLLESRKTENQMIIKLLPEYAHYRGSHAGTYLDMLTKCFTIPPLSNIDVAIFDEAQDFTTLQFQVIVHLFQNVKRMYFAGDDDQSIYTQLGADVNLFNAFPADEVEILNKSYRLPQRVWENSIRLIMNVKHRQMKRFLPRNDKGTYSSSAIISPIEIVQYLKNKRDALILCYTNFQVRRMAEVLTDYGLHVKIKGKPFVPEDKLRASIQYIMALKAGWNEKKLDALEYDAMNFDYSTNFCLADRMCDRKQSVFEFNANITTLHGAKGMEADDVIIFTRMPAKFLQQMKTDEEYMLRLMYVGMTRAKKHLYLMPSNDSEKNFPIKEYLRQGEQKLQQLVEEANNAIAS